MIRHALATLLLTLGLLAAPGAAEAAPDPATEVAYPQDCAACEGDCAACGCETCGTEEGA